MRRRRTGIGSQFLGHVSDLFSGCGSVSRAVLRTGFDSVAYVVRNGEKFNVVRNRVMLKLLKQIRGDVIFAVMLAPPCSSFSVAFQRNGTVRSRQQPWGITDLPNHLHSRVSEGNKTMKAAFRIAQTAHQAGIPWILENPYSSWAFKTPEARALQQKGAVFLKLDQCQYGTPWKNRTGLLAGNLDVYDLARLNKTCDYRDGRCSKSGRPHVVLEGGRLTGPVASIRRSSAVPSPTPSPPTCSAKHITHPPHPPYDNHCNGVGSGIGVAN